MARRATGRRSRRGGIYIAVLGASILVAILGVTALTATAVERLTLAGSADQAMARQYAESAVQLGLLTIATDPNWRANQPNGNWRTSQAIGDGTMTLTAIDPIDGDIKNSASHPVLLQGTGVRGTTTQMLQVRLEPSITALTCLDVSLQSGLAVTLNGVTVNSNQIVASNATVTATTATVNADVEGAAVTGGTYNRTTKAPVVPPRTMPDATVFNYYLANGTTIPLASIPKTGINYRLEKQLLSPSVNPYGGGTNPQGIYVIDCQGSNLLVMTARIVGTLVLLNPSSNSAIQTSMVMEPAVPGYPVLLVQGDMAIKTNTSTLDEGAAGVNFNPPSTPYKGTSNTNMTDTFPTGIEGLVYVSGNLTTSSNPIVTGVVVAGGTVNATGALDVTYDPKFAAAPPPGFAAGAGGMTVAANSWMRIVNP